MNVTLPVPARLRARVDADDAAGLSRILKFLTFEDLAPARCPLRICLAQSRVSPSSVDADTASVTVTAALSETVGANVGDGVGTSVGSDVGSGVGTTVGDGTGTCEGT